jgi:hypothetical protein
LMKVQNIVESWGERFGGWITPDGLTLKSFLHERNLKFEIS